MFKQFLNDNRPFKIFELRGLGTFKAVLSHSGTLNLYSSDNNDDLLNCNWVDEGPMLHDRNITYFDISVLDGNNLVCVYNTVEGNNKVVIWPGDFPLYGNSDPYRLYYAIDSEILYMNVENRWIPVSYLSHNKMKDIGTLTHDQLESAIVGALERINNLESTSQLEFTTKEW